MPRRNDRLRRADRKSEAEARQEEYDSLMKSLGGPAAQLKDLDKSPGESRRERAKLKARITAQAR